jgi:penicillin-binding protein 2
MFEGVRKAIPSMYARRLLLLACCLLVAAVMLVVKLGALTLVHGEESRERAEQAMIDGYLIQTIRGQILDRKGRVLAVDRPSSDLSVPYSVVTGTWSYSRAYLDARRANLERWRELSPEERERYVAEYQPVYDGQLKQFWKTIADVGKVSLDDLERINNDTKARVQAMATYVWIRQQKKREAELKEAVDLADVAKEIEEQRSNHVVLRGLDPQAVLTFQRLIADGKSKSRVRDEKNKPVYNDLAAWVNAEVTQSTSREYPMESMNVSVDRKYLPSPLRSETPLNVTVEGVGSHIIGAMRKVYADEVKERPFVRNMGTPEQMVDLGGYMGDDRVGEMGIERSMEDQLRGARGKVLENLETGAVDRREPMAGEDVHLTVDIALQARIQAIMDPGNAADLANTTTGLMRLQPFHSADPEANVLRPQYGEALNGSAVVIDIQTGDVLAAVSMPSMKRKMLKESREAVYGDQLNQTWLNRPVQMQYMPGSTMKPLVYCAAVSEGLIAPGQHIECKGHLYPNQPTQFRCWIYKTFHQVHGSLSPQEALAYSCNIYFYELGRRFGPEKLTVWYRKFGLGQKLGVGLNEEIPGVLPDLADIRKFNTADATFMGIGQGPIQVTPIQVANAFATIVRGGMSIPPGFVQRPENRAALAVDIGLNKQAVIDAQEGLFGSSNWDHGTTHHLGRIPGSDGRGERIFTIPGVQVAGKSGTADAVPLRLDTDGDKRVTSKDQKVREGDHAWFVGLVKKDGDKQYRYVVTVVVEYAGSGGAVAGPVANQVILALKQEGYL